MTRTFLTATVAALAITAPAQAERGGKNKDQAAVAQEEQARPAKAQRGGGEQRVRAERPQRVERPQREQRVRMERPQREQRVRMERPQREQRVRMERPQREQRVRMERPQREQRVRQERIERRSVIERQARAIQPRGGDRFDGKQVRQQQRQADRLAKFQQKIDRREAKVETRAAQRQLSDSFRNERLQRSLVSVGDRFDGERMNRDWYDNYAAQRVRTFYDATPNYFYNYDRDDGYLYQVNRDSNLVTALYPLLGGAFSVGQQMPYGYDSYNVPYAYRSLYYDTPDYGYRYGDGAIYRVDPDTQMISAVVALLTGQSFGIGQQLPMGYDVYNVPYAYRDMYADSDDSWYRYDDGYIYQVDPYSRMIEGMYPLSYGGYAVGYPVPSYASYGGYTGYSNYAAPYGYENLYYSQPGYNYQYANNGIYQVDPTTQLVSALVALVTGTNLGVGQMLPAGYDAYNVPDAYRSTYFDTDDSWYRYDDGMIYGVDPYSRMIETAIPVSYGVYPVGYAIPSYAGYAVPGSYDGLYLEQPGYDYRYANGGIYAVDPDSLQVQSVAALLTGQTLGVGGRMPMGYDAYNVPYDYRDRYYDTADSWYRYNDGYIYQVDPQTRLIQAVIDAVV